MPWARDFARGALGIALWGAPIGVLVAASAIGSLGLATPEVVGALWVGGSAWLGGTCLVNAIRCGRTHCWIMGVLLPALGVVGLTTLAGWTDVPWSWYATSLWVIIIGAFVCESVLGPYLSSGRA